MNARSYLAVAVTAVFTAGPAAAQVAWESPMVLPPQDQPGLGIYLMDAAGGGIGVMGVWSGGHAPRMGLRAGVAEDRRPARERGIAAFFGADFTGQLVQQTAEFPLQIDWLLGAGASLGNHFRVDIPLGVTLGHQFRADNVRLLPYLTPRVVVGGEFSGGGGLGLDLAIDLGVDLGFQPTWSVRFGGTFGDRSALAIGIVF
jgi:hypothetical protein